MLNRAAVTAAFGMFLLGRGVSAQVDEGAVWAPTDPARTVPGCCGQAGRPVLQAVRIAGHEVRIDGRVTEAPWLHAPVATDFVQFEPSEGQPGTERTEARVLYGDDALYVAIRAYDRDPDGIVGQLTRRDQDSYSDLVGVVVDSYFDRRTAFQFVVNPVGVKQDVYRFDDTNEDDGWDAVWDVATSKDAEGWTAEFRIPYSQLRFRDAPDQTWGINFFREIARRDETDVWAPLSRTDAAIVSRSGELRGLENLDAPRRVEVVPYTVARVRRAPGDPENPFYRRNERFGTVGADLKYGVTSDLTLDVTLNPDFGQVEADPAQVNLTAFESFYPERRPFFVEGSSIFRFALSPGDGDDANESLFYSRRIGRAPQGEPDDRGGWVDMDPQTTILGAAKLSGKTASGWSVGALQAVTSEETASVAPADGTRLDETVEPFTSYGMVRVQRDFRAGRSAVGLVATAVNRDRQAADALALRRHAYTGGVDFRHRFADERFEVSGYLLGSHVGGSATAIDAAQRSSVRYYQRPDAGYLRYDPTRTTLDGASAFLAFAKIGGSAWQYSTGVLTRSPGFEVNDIGFQRDADNTMTWVWVGYRQTTPTGPFRRYNLNLNGWTAWNYGGDRTALGGNVNGSVQLKNFWNAYGGVNREASVYSGRTLRGGPLFKREPSTNFWMGIGTDSRQAVRLEVNGWGTVRGQSDSWSLGASPSVRFRPSGRATFSVGSSIGRNVNDYQWIGRYGSAAEQPVFARIDQTTVGLTARIDYAFTPTLSLQVYAEPFVSAATFGDYKLVGDPVADRYEDRFVDLHHYVDGGQVVSELDGDGLIDAFDQPDFNYKQFRSNTVLRWEYRPGSTLFLVWSQGRDQSVERGDFDLRGDMGDLFGVRPDNVFMIKVSYWMSP